MARLEGEFDTKRHKQSSKADEMHRKRMEKWKKENRCVCVCSRAFSKCSNYKNIFLNFLSFIFSSILCAGQTKTMSAFPPFVSYLFRSGTIRVLPRIHYQYKQFRTSGYRRWVTWSVGRLCARHPAHNPHCT